MTGANLDALVERAAEGQRRLEAQGATEDARVVEQVMRALTALRPKKQRPHYIVAAAADLIGVSGRAVKNWISCGLLTGYRLGGRYVIPRSGPDDYRSAVEASKGITPLPEREEIVAAVRERRRRFVWPAWRTEHERPH
jgi:hypothetical protein